jgi:hypothetical protein
MDRQDADIVRHLERYGEEPLIPTRPRRSRKFWAPSGHGPCEMSLLRTKIKPLRRNSLCSVSVWARQIGPRA